MMRQTGRRKLKFKSRSERVIPKTKKKNHLSCRYLSTYILNSIYYFLASVGEKLTTLKTQRLPQYSRYILYTYLAACYNLHYIIYLPTLCHLYNMCTVIFLDKAYRSTDDSMTVVYPIAYIIYIICYI